MILDLNSIETRKQLCHTMARLRNHTIALDQEKNKEISFFVPKNCLVLQYYAHPSILFQRICDIAQISPHKVRLKNNTSSTIYKALVFNIMRSFGHTNQEICNLLNIGSASAGMTQYYRDKLKDLMKTDRSVVYLYETINRILEKDKEDLEDEIC